MALNRTALCLSLGAVAAISRPSAEAGAATLQEAHVALQAQHYAAAYAMLSELARHGDPQAALDLGGLYDLGEGVPEDPATALRWYLTAARAGLPAAELDTGLMYDVGRGTARDATQAATWYARAAARGSPRGAYDLGQLYETGDGVPRNDDLADAWYKQAAGEGLEAAGQRDAALHQRHGATATIETAKADAAAPAALVAPVDGAALPTDAAAPCAELVWTLPAGTTPPRFYVEVLSLADPAPKPILHAYVSTSATLVHLPQAGGAYAWRVYVVSTGTQSYQTTPWRHFSAGPLPGTAAPS